MKTNGKNSLRIPCYNEGLQVVEYGDHNLAPIKKTQSTIYNTLSLLSPYINTYYDTVILSNDGSSDDTMTHIHGFLNKNPSIRNKTTILEDTTNHGKSYWFFEVLEYLYEHYFTTLVMTDADLVECGTRVYDTLSGKLPISYGYERYGMITSHQAEWFKSSKDYHISEHTSGTRAIDIERFFERANYGLGYIGYKANTLGFGLEAMLYQVFSDNHTSITSPQNFDSIPKFLHPFRTKPMGIQEQDIIITKQQLGIQG